MTMKIRRPTFRAVDELLDRLVAQARIRTGVLQPAGDLLG